MSSRNEGRNIGAEREEGGQQPGCARVRGANAAANVNSGPGTA